MQLSSNKHKETYTNIQRHGSCKILNEQNKFSKHEPTQKNRYITDYEQRLLKLQHDLRLGFFEVDFYRKQK